MRMAGENGVKVVLNGHGADETLAGYPGFFVPPYLAQLLMSGRFFAYLRERRAFSGDPEWSGHQVLAQLGDRLPRRLAPLLKPEIPPESDTYPPLFRTAASLPRIEPLGGGATMLSEALWTKLTRHILPMWLRAEDRMSMASSIESRPPFLDYRLVELAFRLPDNLKLRYGMTKYILRQAMHGTAPDSITMNKVKRRFASPFAAWFRGPWESMVRKLLIEDPGALGEFVVSSALYKRTLAYLAGDDDTANPSLLERTA